VDACNSGGVIANRLEVDTVPPSFRGETDPFNWEVVAEAVKLYRSYPGLQADVSPLDAIVIAASGEQEFSYESPVVAHGILTFYLLACPTYADLDGDGGVTALEAFAFCKANIDHYWNEPRAGTDMAFLPHISGGPVDFLLFRTDKHL